MAIPLVGGGRPAIDHSPKDMLVGDSSTFDATLGGWSAVGTGCTVARITAQPLLTGRVGAMQFDADSNTDYCEVSVPGRFYAGKRYWFCAAVSKAYTPELNLGLIGTDSASKAFPVTFLTDENYPYVWLAVTWVPTATRTGVKARIRYTGAVAKAQYIGQARVIQSEFVPLLPMNNAEVNFPLLSSNGSFSATETGFVMTHADGGSFYIYGPDEQAGLDLYGTNVDGNANVYIYAPASDGVQGDLSDEGVWFNVGYNWIGLYFSEKDATTFQLYAEAANQMMQLRHRGTTGGWSVSDDGVENARIEAYFDVVLRKSGTLTATTNVCDYFCLPGKVTIDEVRVHVGTAPTGASLIVDVNAGGTTIFTTQGNRPEVAISGTDDTSGVPDGGANLAKDTAITVDVDQIGSTVAGADLYVHIRGKYVW